MSFNYDDHHKIFENYLRGNKHPVDKNRIISCIENNLNVIKTSNSRVKSLNVADLLNEVNKEVERIVQLMTKGEISK